MSRLDFQTKNLSADLSSAAVSAMIAIPDAIASAVLAGVNPTYAFNSLMLGTPIGSLFTSSQFMNIGLTSAMMLAVNDARLDLGETAVISTLFTLTLLVGLYQVLFGLFKLGQFTKFISNTVMTGFIMGVAILVILGQLGDLTGYKSGYSNTVARAADTLVHAGQIDPITLAVGLGTMAAIVLLDRTRLRNLSVALGIVLGTAVVLLLNLSSVALVGDTSQISGSLPLPVLPDLTLVPRLLLPAFAIALIGLVQSSGVSQGIPNPDGSYADASGDFVGQGVANVVAGTFRGLPLGGSVGGTAIIKSTGGRSRWANVFLGLFVAVFVIFFAGAVEKVAMPAIAGALILVGLSIISGNRAAFEDVWDVSTAKRAIMLITLAATLILPVQQAVLLGIFLSFVDFAFSASQRVQLMALRPTADNTFIEEAPPATLDDGSITILYARGNPYFAAVRTIQDQLPASREAQRAVVILRMRSSSEIGTTFIIAAERYARELAANGGKLMLSGVTQDVMAQLLRTETHETLPLEDIFLATPVIGESTRAAVAAAEEWQRRAKV